MFIFFLMPLFSANNSLQEFRSTFETNKALFESKISTLEKIRERKSELESLREKVSSLLPNKVIPIEYTTYVKQLADRNFFFEINENSVPGIVGSSQETPIFSPDAFLDVGFGEVQVFEQEKKPIEGSSELQNITVRFNGKTIGQLATVNFLKEFAKGSSKLTKINSLDYFEDLDNGFARVSFNIDSPFIVISSDPSPDLQIVNILENEDFFKFMEFFNK
jgi:hypothetical protein